MEKFVTGFTVGLVLGFVLSAARHILQVGVSANGHVEQEPLHIRRALEELATETGIRIDDLRRFVDSSQKRTLGHHNQVPIHRSEEDLSLQANNKAPRLWQKYVPTGHRE